MAGGRNALRGPSNPLNCLAPARAPRAPARPHSASVASAPCPPGPSPPPAPPSRTRPATASPRLLFQSPGRAGVLLLVRKHRPEACLLCTGDDVVRLFPKSLAPGERADLASADPPAPGDLACFPVPIPGASAVVSVRCRSNQSQPLARSVLVRTRFVPKSLAGGRPRVLKPGRAPAGPQAGPGLRGPSSQPTTASLTWAPPPWPGPAACRNTPTRCRTTRPASRKSGPAACPPWHRTPTCSSRRGSRSRPRLRRCSRGCL
jgi:hypothetical protein